MHARNEVVRNVRKQHRKSVAAERSYGMQFGAKVFHQNLMEQVLPKKVFQNLNNVREGKEKFDLSGADAIASALKDWAVSQGATHFTHWFHPLTGISAEKHDSFLQWKTPHTPIEGFSGKDLLRAEPDASSFPSGGLRSTHQARGYTVWDPASFPFLWEGGDGVTLFIPALFFSWTGFALDHKIPMIRSEDRLNAQVLRLLQLCNVSANHVFTTVGLEQEYFAIDKTLYRFRPDLLLCGRTVYGARPAKGQELEDHYFGSLKDRVMTFMRSFEDKAIQLGIPIKTRHNEVAPAQHEVAPLFERASLAVDHNILLMEIMRQTANEQDLSCLFHEKPFANVNGSGKHINWSLATDTGLNLLEVRTNSMVFFILLTAILKALHDHANLLRASIGSAGNDYRLGGSEAPPTILSVYLGTALEKLIDDILQEKVPVVEMSKKIDLGLAHLPEHEIDVSDRNRTSFFAFTGNKFEFRAVGSSVNCGFPITILNAIVADALRLIIDEMQDIIQDRSLTAEQCFAAVLPCLRKHLRASCGIVFGGNAYAAEWEKEAQRRGLPNIRKSFHAFAHLLDPMARPVFEYIFTQEELESRYEVCVEQYVKTMQIEANLMIELFRTQILPAALKDQKNRAKSVQALRDINIPINPHVVEEVTALTHYLTAASEAVHEVEKVLAQTVGLGIQAKGKVFCEIVSPKMDIARTAVDRLEMNMDDTLWPLPKYRELLFII